MFHSCELHCEHSYEELSGPYVSYLEIVNIATKYKQGPASMFHTWFASRACIHNYVQFPSLYAFHFRVSFSKTRVPKSINMG